MFGVKKAFQKLRPDAFKGVKPVKPFKDRGMGKKPKPAAGKGIGTLTDKEALRSKLQYRGSKFFPKSLRRMIK
jgi:hypothetical protein